MGLKIEIPKDWRISELKSVCQAVTGTTPPKSDPKNYGYDIPFVKPPQLFDKPVHDAPEKLSLKGAKIARVLPPNSVLVTCIGNLGRTAINTVSVAFNQQINALIPSEDVNSKFLFYQTQSWYFRKQLDELSSATTVAIVNKGKFETIEIAIPPPDAQVPIVEKIEELFSELDKGIENLKTAQQQLKVYRQAVLKWAFEGKLTEDFRCENPNLKSAKTILSQLELERENLLKAASKRAKKLIPISKDEMSALPDIPTLWQWVKLGDHSFVTKLAGFEFTKYVNYSEGGEIPVIRAQNVAKEKFIPRNFYYISREIMEKLPRSRVYGGEILMVFVGAGLGNVGIVPENKEYFLGPNVAKIALEHPFSNKYIHHFLCSQLGFLNVTGMSKATAQGSISMANIREVSVPLMSVQEQYQIVQEIESRLSVCDKMEETINTSLQQAEALRQSILKRAFEGKLVKNL